MSKEYSYLQATPYQTDMSVANISEIYYDLGEIIALSFDNRIDKRAIRKNIKAIKELNNSSGEMAEDVSMILEEVEQATSSKHFPAQTIYKLSCIRNSLYKTMLQKESVA